MQKALVIIVFSAIHMVTPEIAYCQNLLPDSVVQELKKGVEGFQSRFHSPAIVVAIVHDKSIIFSDALGYTDIENKVPATIDSKFPILSVTKTFTATMFMQL